MKRVSESNRPVIRNLLFIFQKKHSIESINGYAKINHAFVSFAQSKGINYCFLSLDDFNKMALEFFSTSVQKGGPLHISEEWSKFFNACHPKVLD